MLASGVAYILAEILVFICEVVLKVERRLVLTGLWKCLGWKLGVRLHTRLEIEVGGLKYVLDHPSFRFARLSRH